MIEIQNLWVYYGRLVAVRALTVSVPEGSICALIGPNGAGKTSTIRVLATLLRPAGGIAKVAGRDVTLDPIGVRRVLGYVPDAHGVYDTLTVEDYLDFFASTYGIPPAERKRVVEFAVELTDLKTLRLRKTGSLSRGMRQRLSVARALVHDPKVLVLDEPASGLDPRARIEFRALLKELRAMGKTLLISSHILTELEEVCDSIAVIERGQMVACGRIEDIRRALAPNPAVTIETAEPPGADHVALLRALECVRDVQPDGTRIRFVLLGDNAVLAQVVRRLVCAGMPIAQVHKEEVNLENLYMRLTRGEVH